MRTKTQGAREHVRHKARQVRQQRGARGTKFTISCAARNLADSFQRRKEATFNF